MSSPSRMTWNQLAEYKRRGLRTKEMHIRPNGEIIIMIDPETSHVMHEGDDPKQLIVKHMPPLRARNGRLGAMLADLYWRAENALGTPQRMQLPGGMRVDAIIGIDGLVRLQISRPRVTPSETEWKTTLKYLPFKAPDAQKEHFEHKGCHYLRTEWKIEQLEPHDRAES